MSRRSAKPSAASGKAAVNFASSAFGAFSDSPASTLSYLSEMPDLFAISDANAVVPFKNLLKKDATTRAKALEDLIAYVEAHPYELDGGAEEPILEAWVQFYPRIAIDNSRRVRELSHSLQLALMLSARKRMEKRLPRVVGTWLAGSYDRDRGVARNATEGLASFLKTDEKTLLFWKKCQPQILEYASAAILETPDTLSDPLCTTPMDAEAKYYRVQGASLALVLNLLQKLDAADLEKQQDAYDGFFENDKVWKSALVEDAAVRRSSCHLLLACLQKRRASLASDLARLSNVFVAEGLKSDQSGSAPDYIRALTALTIEFPTVWTTDYTGRKPPASRLRTFLEKGSQGSASSFWGSLNKLLEALPRQIIRGDTEGSLEFMKSMRVGITSRNEPRSNAVDAWACYLDAARRFLAAGNADLSSTTFVEEAIFPITRQFLSPLPEQAVWTSSGQILILIKAYSVATTSTNLEAAQATEQEWEYLKNEFKNRIKNSLPEASKNHEKSQKAIADEGSRWFTLAGKLLEGHEKTAGTGRPLPDIPAIPSIELLLEALSLLETRNWKPFGAAATVESALKLCPYIFRPSSPKIHEVRRLLATALPENMETLLASSSVPYMLSSIVLLGEIPGRENDFTEIWTANTEAILPLLENHGALPALVRLISSSKSSPLARQNSHLQSQLLAKSNQYASGSHHAYWDLLSAAVQFEALSEASEKQLAKDLAAQLTSQPGKASPEALKALVLMARKNPDLFHQDEEIYMSLMASLLTISESSSASPELATLRSLLDRPSGDKSNLIGIIHQNLNDAGSGSLAIETLVQQARQVLDAQKGEAEPTDIAALMPDPEIWARELAFCFDTQPDPSLSITSNLGGSYFLVSAPSQSAERKVARDRAGCSVAGRMAMYTTQLLNSGISGLSKPHESFVEWMVLLSLTAEVTRDQLDVKSKDQVWKTLALEETAQYAEEFVSSARITIDKLAHAATGWRDGEGSLLSRAAHDIINKMLVDSADLSPKNLYSARGLSELTQKLAETHGFSSSMESWLTQLDILKVSQASVLPAVAILSGFGEVLSASKSTSTFCNRLVSDVAGAKLDSEKTLLTLVLLNASMPIFEVGELPVANNRLVFAIKQITSWLEAPDEVDYKLAAEICQSLRLLLPCAKDVFGSYWELTVNFCIHLWTQRSAEPLASRLPYIHASLRLMTTLKSLEEPNDDLVDVLQSTAQARASALLGLLQLPREEQTQPLDIVDGIICRQVEKLPLPPLDDLSDMYGLVAADSKAIQTAAFTVLHRALKDGQEKIAMDVILEKRTAQLPDELLSLLLEPPTLDAYSDEALARFPLPIRSYLLAWYLVFDAIGSASLEVRSHYAENLKSQNFIGPLMDFTFDVLGHSAAHALNLDKAKFTEDHIAGYDVKLADSMEEGERNMQWLLIHLYYLVLKYTPGQFKTWFINCRSKQTKIAVEGWMARYFSPLIITKHLDEVAQWGEAQEPEIPEDEEPMTVKVSHSAKEIIVGYPVDEEHASILIRVPTTYPLEGVSVLSTKRVGVSDKKWQSWLMTTQGVITFSGGSIVDGIMAFRRNMVGALKGQTECAICYSIVGSDNRMPDKRCTTCKNLFHKSCLFKWFQNSSHNTCPLCRNPVDMLGNRARTVE